MPACFGFGAGTWVRPLGGDPIADIAPAPSAPTATTAASARRFVRVIRIPPVVDPRHAREANAAACYDRVESLRRSGDRLRAGRLELRVEALDGGLRLRVSARVAL